MCCVIVVSVCLLEDREWFVDCLDCNGCSFLYVLFFFCFFVIDFCMLLFLVIEFDNIFGISGFDSCIYLVGKEWLVVFGFKFLLKV